MIAKIGRGAGASGLLAYALNGSKSGADKGGRIIGGSAAGADYASLSREFAAVRALRQDVARPVWHCSLSLAHGESLTDDQWSELVDNYMICMGFSDCALYVAVRHDDTEHEHVHIVASRVQLDGSLYLGARDALRSMPLTNDLAAQFGLSHVAHDKPAARAAISTGERGRAERTGETPARLRLQSIIDGATRDKPTLDTLIKRLSHHNVTIIPSGKTGAPQGFSYSIDGIIFSGTKLGDKYKLAKLKRVIDYNIERDQILIDKLRQNANDTLDISRGDTIETKIDDQKQRVTRSRTLDLAFEKTPENGVYSWKKTGRPAFIDNGDVINAYSQSDTAIRAVVQLAMDKGWTSIKCGSNSIEYQRRLYLIAGEMGMPVTSYTPTDTDIKQLQYNIDNNRNKYGWQNRNSETAVKQRVSATADDNRTVEYNKLDRKQSKDNNGKLEDTLREYQRFVAETRETVSSEKPKNDNNNSISERDHEFIDQFRRELLLQTETTEYNRDKQLDTLRIDNSERETSAAAAAPAPAATAATEALDEDDDDDDEVRMR